MLDSGANCGIFMNKNLLTNLRTIESHATINGVSGQIITNVVGIFNNMSEVYYHPHAIANILSQSQEKDNGARVTYDDDHDIYSVCYEEREPIVFERIGGLYCFDTLNPHSTSYRALTSTVHDNKLKFTKREVQRADKAIEVRRRLAYPNDATIPHMHSINNIPVSRQDLQRAVDIYGRDRNCIRGKMKNSKSIPATIEKAYKSTDIPQHLCVDLLFIDGDGYMIAVLTPLDYTIVVHIKNRKTKTLRGALWHILAKIDEQQFEVTHILSDREGGIGPFHDELKRAGYHINPAGSGEHVPVVERKIETLKERVRSYLQSLPYTLMFSVLRYLVEYCVVMINLAPDNQRVDPTSPYELFTGYKVDYKTQLRISFGDYAECKNPNRKPINTIKPRTDPCIALLPLLNAQGSYLFFDLTTRRTVVRDKWIQLPMPNDIITRCENLAKAQGKALRVLPHFSRGVPVDEDNQTIETMSDTDLFDQTQHPDVLSDDAASSIDDQPPSDYNHHGEQTFDNSEESLIPADTPHIENEPNDVIIPGPFEEHAPDDLYVEKPIVPEEDHSYQTRSRGEPTLKPYKDGRHWLNANAALTKKQKLEFGVFANLSIREAIDKYGDPAKQAVISELQQLIRLQVFRFHQPHSLSKQQLKDRIPSRTFVKAKVRPDGSFDKLKARLVGGGHRQKRSYYTENDTSSPTISPTGVLLLATIAARERRHVITADIGGAYLRAKMQQFILILLNREESDFLCEIYPELEQYRDERGRLTGEALKAIYGCIESAKLWYETISSKLISIGYVRNPYDPCIFNKWHEPQRVQSSIGLHVDDTLMTCADLEVLESLVQWFIDEFEELSVTRGLVHQYTGMTLDFREPMKLIITMVKHVTDLIKLSGITGTAISPATDDLFAIDENSPLLIEKQRELFHSVVYSALYICKRIKPEVLTVVSVLASRVTCATEQDWKKLSRMIQYINHTKDIPLCLEMSSDYPIKVVASIDSSHATHGDYRGHTGLCATLGKGCILAMSSKQKINTKSSAETELVGTSDAATSAIFLRNLIIGQGLECMPLIIEQDNQSAMAMMERGQAIGPTSKHINIRYFWLTDRQRENEVVFMYRKTEDMTSDILSKPVQGSLFRKHRDTLLNCVDR
jgi:Reverse transcriptase (RNA-dependent DNA polymerase)